MKQRKQIKKTGSKNKKNRERQRKSNWKRGRPKKAKDKQRETLKNKQKCLFPGENRVFSLLEAKKGKEKQQNNKQIRRV